MADIIDLSSQLITGMGAEQALYQVPNSSMLVLQDVINATWTEANTKANLLSAKVTTTGAAIDALIATPGTLHVAAGSVTGATATEPTVSIPATAAVADIYADYETQYTELVTLLTDKFTDFRTTYFPNESAAHGALQTWLSDTLDDPTVVAPTNVTALDVALTGFISSPTAGSARSASLVAFLDAYIAAPTLSLSTDQVSLNNQLSAFIADPTVDSAALTALAGVLDGYISTPTSPLPSTVIDALWEDARAKVLTDLSRAQDNAAQFFAAKRFPLPPGALAGQVLQLQQGAQDKLAEATRAAAIKGADMAYDKVKFAVTEARQLHTTLVGLTEERLKLAVVQAQALRQALFDAIEKRLALCVDAARTLAGTMAQLDEGRLNLAVTQAADLRMKVFDVQERRLAMTVDKMLALRQMAMTSAVAYIQALASGPDMASRLVGIGYDAQSKLISSASQFYNSRIAAAEMANKVGQFNKGLELEAAGKNQAADLSLIEDKIKALLTETQAIAQMATSLFNNLHASVGLTANGGTAISTSGSF